MTAAPILAARLHAQGLAGKRRPTADAVRGLGAMQSQELRFALWSLALRSDEASGDAVRAALDSGELLRTHALRPTWHFLHPDDIRWVQRLTAPRVLAAVAYQERLVEIDEAVAGAAIDVVAAEIDEHGPRTRTELGKALERKGIGAGSNRLAHLLMRAELGNVVTSGPQRGRSTTYDLLDRRAPSPGRDLGGDEALAELTVRYYTSHGPASEKDFAWWATFTLAQVRRGIKLAGDRLEAVEHEGVAMWQRPGARDEPPVDASGVLLLPVYDEYVVAYQDTRRAAYAAPGVAWSEPNPQAQPLVVDGQVVGWWRHTLKEPTLALFSVVELTADQRTDAEAAAQAFLEFSAVDGNVRWTDSA